MNVRLRYTTKFTAGIFFSDRLMMNNYQVSLNMITASEDSDDHNVALDRIKYFIENQLKHTIFINSKNFNQCRALADAGLKITTLPEEPIDQVIGIMLYCKLNAILEDRLIVVEVEVSSELGDNIVYFHDEEEAQGPFETVGWWKESDTVHCDFKLFDSEKVVALNHIGAGWNELGLHWEDSIKLNIDIEDNKVVFADFAKDETK
ncbi:hypothetical protein UFOVP328_49 [uncultured Caudovirales phage]|uniref:Uncharacterized protein n=1 Tax=uncultured Caudovirales phage TaxID=2100421 RepID=A0A6J5LWY5_9CAUD|nr:hypothetical protein UFOVP328_49 [uncultured Caudovirales phage]